MIALVGILVFIIVAVALISSMSKPPPVETKEQLMEDDYSPKEAREELRAQRAEHRAHSRAVGTSLRTANKVSRLAMSITKKIK